MTLAASVGSGTASFLETSSRTETPTGWTYHYATFQFSVSSTGIGWTFAGWQRRVRTTVYHDGNTTVSEWTAWEMFSRSDPWVVELRYQTEWDIDGVWGYSRTDYEYEVRAVFISASSSYAISVAANPSDGGTVSGGGTYADGAACTISATAGSGRIFTKWVCSDGSEITDASYTFTVSASLTFTAQFEDGTGMPICDGTSGEIMFGENGEILFDG